MYRTLNKNNALDKYVNTIQNTDALSGLQKLPDGSIALIVTSPPYWNIIDYGVENQLGHTDYDTYIGELLEIWKESERVLIPNGKLVIITPIMPISKSVISEQHTRHIKNINNDIEFSILGNIPSLKRYSLFIWQKQTSVKMFGSYPYPPNLYEDNTIEFINVFVKDGAPPSISGEAKETSKLSQEEWVNLTAQIWPLYPEDVKRVQHPAPFPITLPQRLILMYTFASNPEAGFNGDIVLDMFNGSGSTCLAAKATGRNWIGIDINPEYCAIAEQRLKFEYIDSKKIILEKVKVTSPRSLDDALQLSLFPEDNIGKS